MKRTVFLVMVLVSTLLMSCNNGSNNSQQLPFGRGGGMGPGNFDPQAMVDRQIEDMDENLDLSNEQEEKIREIMEESFENMAAMREEMQNSGAGFEGMREQMQKSREEQNKKMKAVLSEEQWEKYQVMQEERRERRGQGGMPPQN
ncbi:hypothetical protein [Draconibacterium halophilum]|uniref:LTXXQ motif family protein n=1 Tax=Draconibacterium halophilum TaxID=2706887 RepID=A0A6C0REA3_9BACT|nr:hypothetical protein [Draconibacterium halophilum]QIA08700.1 hypothetical protein G0Q07_13660 [Draconibacterium halophilum]